MTRLATLGVNATRNEKMALVLSSQWRPPGAYYLPAAHPQIGEILYAGATRPTARRERWFGHWNGPQQVSDWMLLGVRYNND